MKMLEEATISCPYCGEAFTTVVDLSVGSQEYVEDCYVCCQPITITVEADADGELLNLSARQENE
jgi:hypothetical protein